jgi:REP element-mobilizing transposase RayT
MVERLTYFITWTTYGAWLPGDKRGWRKSGAGEQTPQPLLADWSRDRMLGGPVTLDQPQRARVVEICRRHAAIRGWELHAIAVRTNHVHLVVTADAPPDKVRDQFKANATRVLRQGPDAIEAEKIWTRGGDTQIVDRELNTVIAYVTEAQDRKGRDFHQNG